MHKTLLHVLLLQAISCLLAAAEEKVCGVGEQSIWQPLGITLYGRDSLLFADSRHQSIKVINLTSSTLDVHAGSGLKGVQDGPSKFASFSMPYSVAWNPATNLVVVADYGNACIRYITPDDKYTVTMWCGWPITSPTDLAISADGQDIYIADAMSHTILLFTRGDGFITNVAGKAGFPGFADGDSTSDARFHQPLGLALLQHKLYIADWRNNAIRILHTLDRVVTTLLGGKIKGFSDGLFASALISGPKMIRVVDPSAASPTLAISDSDNGAIRLLDLSTSATSTLLGDGTRAIAGQHNAE